MAKERITVTVDRDIIAAAKGAVRAGRAESLSAWINDALKGPAAEEKRRRALKEAIAMYEAELGAITEDQMEEARRWAAARTIRTGPFPKNKRKKRSAA